VIGASPCAQQVFASFLATPGAPDTACAAGIKLPRFEPAQAAPTRASLTRPPSRYCGHVGVRVGRRALRLWPWRRDVVAAGVTLNLSCGVMGVARRAWEANPYTARRYVCDVSASNPPGAVRHRAVLVLLAVGATLLLWVGQAAADPIAWKPCGKGQQCARVPVPLDWCSRTGPRSRWR
jgi:hypothetical protein